MPEPTHLTLTRRQAVGAAGAGGVAFLFAGVTQRAGGSLVAGPEMAQAASATCTMTAAKTEGPYFVDELLNRSTVTSNSDGTDTQPGVPLKLTLYVFDATSDCAPVSGAVVDIWHANASGLYSDVAQNQTTGQNWLRGYQVTDADGKVTFNTIWPGWYQGRAVHIHFKVRTTTSEFTSQLFFTDAMNDAVFANAPYKTRGSATTKDGADGIYGSDGASLLLSPTASGGGYAADFSAGLAGATSGGSGMSTDSSVSAALASAKVLRTASGRRQVRIKVKPEEAVAAAARLTRNGNRIASKKATLDAGTQTIKINLGSGLKAGAARLTLKLTDAAGNAKTFHRSLHIPKRNTT